MIESEEHKEGSAASSAEPSDHSLLRRFRRGSQDAATQLYLRYATRLRALTRAQWSPELAPRIDVDDIVQSVFGSFFRRAATGYYDVPVGEELWKLFLVIALNKIRAKGVFHRAAKRDIRLTCSGEAFEQAVASATGDDEAAYSFLEMTIDEALQRLPTEHKQMIELRVAGHEVAEIARQAGRSRRTVERILQEARKLLAELLDEES